MPSLKRTWPVTAPGRRKRCCWPAVCARAPTYVWDEPLNYIDLFSRIQLEHLILEYQPTMLLVEHDRSFLDAVATGSIHLERP